MGILRTNDWEMFRYSLFCDILEQLGGSEPTDEDIWEQMRESVEVPLAENYYYDEVLGRIKAKLDEEGIESSYYVNSRDTHLHIYIDGCSEEVTSMSEFDDMYERAKAELDDVDE
jgi:hypothetical protein